MKRRNPAAFATAIIAMALAVAAAAQQAGPAAHQTSPDAGEVWSPECGCTTKTFSRLAVAPATLPFVSRGKPQKRFFYIGNTGNAPLPIFEYELNDTTHAFSMTAFPPSGIVIQPKKRIAVSVEFIPAAIGKFVASVTVYSGATRGPQNATVKLTGNAIKPAISPMPTTTATATIMATPTATATATPTTSPTPAGQPTSAALISLLTPGSAVVNGVGFTMDVKGVGFDPSAVVYWNSTQLPTTYVTDTELTAQVPASAISAIGTKFVGIASQGFSIGRPYTFLVGSTGGTGYAQLEINQTANDLVYDPMRQVIYLSVPASAPTQGNTISVLDLASGAITNSTFAGSSPDVLSMSDDDQFLYAGLDGQSAIARFILPSPAMPSLTKDIDISLPPSSNFGPYYPIDLQVAPGSPHTIAATLANMGISPSANGGLIIFDDATARTNIASADNGFDLFDSLQWGADATSLYASNTETSSYDLYKLSIDSSGVTLDNDYPGSFTGGGTRIHYDPGTGLIYADDGIVIDPLTGNPAGAFPPSFGIMVPDSSINAAFFVNTLPSPANITAYNLTQFSLLNTISIPDLTVTHEALRVIRWGNNGIAFNTYNGGPIYLIGGNFVH